MPELAFRTSLGRCLVSWERDRLIGFQLPETDPTPPVSTAEADESNGTPGWILDLLSSVRRHLDGQRQDFASLPFAFDRVTSFQADVYRAALAVKAGSTATYGQLAAALGLPPGASRAVGAALGSNPWPLLVPCHRFVAADGHMTGFSAPGGTRTKLQLLALEGAQWFAV
jgi:methylated-DNA-[protein]-cysteine S-methyltransferase